MAEHEPPADLLDKLARIAHNDIGGCCEYGYPCDASPLHRAQAGWFLTALAEWADGALIDPSTWTRVRAEERTIVGLCLCGATPGDGHVEWCPAQPPLYTLTREDP